MTFQKLGAGLQDRINDLEALAMETASFYITLDNDGATETLISHGPIEVFALSCEAALCFPESRCRRNSRIRHFVSFSMGFLLAGDVSFGIKRT